MKLSNKKHMDTKRILKAFFSFILVSTIVIAIVVLYNEAKYYHNNEEIDIANNLEIKFNNEKEQITNLTNYKLPPIKKGDCLSISYNIPEIKIDNPVLILESYHSVVYVYVDNKMIYKYGENLQKENKVIGHVYLHIPMLHQYKGKKLKIEYHYTEDNSVSYIYKMNICNGEESYLKLINNNFIQIILISTTFAVGIIGLFFSVSRKKFTSENLRMSYISTFSIIAAIWVMCSSKVVFLLFKNLSVVNALEYYSLYSVSIPISLYFSELNHNKIKSRSLKILALLQFMTIIFTVFNYLVLKINYTSFLLVFHIFLMLEFIWILIALINMNSKRKSEIIVIVGVIIMILTGVIDLVKYNLNRYMIIDKVIDFSLLPLGIAIFIFGQVYSFYVERVENISDEKEKNILAKLAFIDILTGINNRTKCEMLFEEYEKKYESIAIVSFDIDNFKYINDNLGHTMGDKAIKDIAVLLKKTFYNIGEVGRMGGDEFIVIVEGNSVKKVRDALEYFLDLLDEYNKSDEIELDISVSYGYGSRKNREEKNITEVYEESDKNMYLCKKNKKEYSKV